MGALPLGSEETSGNLPSIAVKDDALATVAALVASGDGAGAVLHRSSRYTVHGETSPFKRKIRERKAEP
jgi:hypothetical protein